MDQPRSHFYSSLLHLAEEAIIYPPECWRSHIYWRVGEFWVWFIDNRLVWANKLQRVPVVWPCALVLNTLSVFGLCLVYFYLWGFFFLNILMLFFFPLFFPLPLNCSTYFVPLLLTIYLRNNLVTEHLVPKWKLRCQWTVVVFTVSPLLCLRLIWLSSWSWCLLFPCILSKYMHIYLGWF